MTNPIQYILQLPTRLVNAIFGYDFFIAYSQQDGSSYARSLDDALRDDFSVHFDERDYHIGNDLNLLTKIRVRNSRHLVVVATPEALAKSSWVMRETEQFEATGRLPMIIDVDSAVDKALLDPVPGKLGQWISDKRIGQDQEAPIDPILRLKDDSAHCIDGLRVANRDVISTLKASFSGTRIAQRRLQVVSGVAIALFMLLVAAALLANVAYQQLLETVKSKSENSAVAAISFTERGLMPEALSLAVDALPPERGLARVYHPLSISAAIKVFNGLAIGTSDKMSFHILDADFEPSGKLVATVETDFTEGRRSSPRWGRVWNVATGALVNEVPLPQNTSFATEIISDHETAVFGGFSGDLLVWNFVTGNLEEFRGEKGITAIAEIVSKAGLDLFGVASSRGIHVFDLRTGNRVGHVFPNYASNGTGKPDLSFDLHPNGKLLASRISGGVVVFDFFENETVCTVPHGEANLVSMKFSPDGRHLGLTSDDGRFFTVELLDNSNCSDLHALTISPTEGAVLCGRFPAENTNIAYVDSKPWVIRITRETYHLEDIFCGYLFDWQEGKTLSTVLLGRGYMPSSNTAVNTDETHPAHRDLAHLTRLGISIASKDLDVFSYRRQYPKGVFIRSGWHRLNSAGITLADSVSPQSMTLPEPASSDPTAKSWACSDYDTGPTKEMIAVSQSGRFVVVAEPFVVTMHDRLTCERVGLWPISMVRIASFEDGDATLQIVNAQRQTFEIALPTSLKEDDLALRLKRALSAVH